MKKYGVDADELMKLLIGAWEIAEDLEEDLKEEVAEETVGGFTEHQWDMILTALEDRMRELESQELRLWNELMILDARKTQYQDVMDRVNANREEAWRKEWEKTSGCEWNDKSDSFNHKGLNTI